MKVLQKCDLMKIIWFKLRKLNLLFTEVEVPSAGYLPAQK